MDAGPMRRTVRRRVEGRRTTCAHTSIVQVRGETKLVEGQGNSHRNAQSNLRMPRKPYAWTSKQLLAKRSFFSLHAERESKPLSGGSKRREDVRPARKVTFVSPSHGMCIRAGQIRTIRMLLNLNICGMPMRTFSKMGISSEKLGIHTSPFLTTGVTCSTQLNSTQLSGNTTWERDTNT
jgi:hypothetical protein